MTNLISAQSDFSHHNRICLEKIIIFATGTWVFIFRSLNLKGAGHNLTAIGGGFLS